MKNSTFFLTNEFDGHNVLKNKGMSLMDSTYKAVLGVIGSDCHVVGNRILDRFFSTSGVEVINLGVMVSQEEFIEAAKEHNADAILVSSIYGHGEIECQGLREQADENNMSDLILYVGGNLVIGKKPWAEVEELFLAMGYDRVFAPSADLKRAVALLKDDIDMRRMSMTGHNSAKATTELAATA
jgi:methylaspartate mutase sigma subunit